MKPRESENAAEKKAAFSFFAGNADAIISKFKRQEENNEKINSVHSVSDGRHGAGVMRVGQSAVSESGVRRRVIRIVEPQLMIVFL